ncbi:MAG: diguanylate cyclase [Rhodopseudomonas palustris]|uniref:diguanylate cyclase n=1 Tax=Rhodopseudomonas palustris TaxID=1076 RepID=A0A933S2X0_RHOPL|nr:diguanylate cyclase [Rhodopseudomonas palustris]
MSNARGNPTRRLSVATGFFVAMVCISIVGLSAWRELGSRAADLKNAEVETSNLARSLTQYADDTFELADNFLMSTVSRLEMDGGSFAAIARLRKVLESRRPGLGRIRGLFVYDSTGRWLATTEEVDIGGLNNGDRDYFRFHRESSDRGTHLGDPVKSRSGGQWIVTASRRFDNADGSFAGVVLATVDVAHFSQFFGKFDIGPNGSVSMLSRSGVMLARMPEDESYIGRDMSGTALIKDLPARPRESVYYFRSPLDGRERLSSYMVSTRYPLVLLATKAKDDVLAGWRQEATSRMIFVTGLASVIGTIGLFLVRQLAQRQRMVAALRAQEADFRLLAEESSDMVMRVGLDERIVYVSPSCSRVLGWDATSLRGTSALGGVNAADLGQVERAVADLKRGAIEETKIVYRTQHREKKEIWLETALRATRSPETGEIDGVVAISRDMTEHKVLEQKLAALATTDSLTGLANRRQFDERLQEEWARATRDGTPLSLLMIDLDHFKRFNDHYGHQSGDGALRALAAILVSEALRPADLPARYGGEEFVMLLPKTDLQGCQRVGDRVRSGLHELSLPHAQNTPPRIMTASVGAATAWPGAAGTDSAKFVEAADQAMYAAKEAGRDRLVLAGQVIRWPRDGAHSVPSAR